MEMHIHSVFIPLACGARSSAPTCQSAPYGAAGIFATPPGAIFSQGAQGPDMPGFRHPRNPARSPRRPAQIGESPRRSRRPGPRSNRGAIRPLPRRAAPAPPARRRRAIRACAPACVHRPANCPAPAAPARASGPAADRFAPGRSACGSHAPRRAMPRPGQAPPNRSQTSRAPQRTHNTAGAAPPRRRGLAQAAGAAGGGWRARAAGGALAHLGDAAPGEAGVQPGRIYAAIDGPAMRPRRHGGLHGEALRRRAAAAAPVTRRCAGLNMAGGANCRSEDSGAGDPRGDPRSAARSKGAPAPQGAPPPARPCRRRISGDPRPRGRGRAAAQAPPCDCLPKGRACPKAAPAAGGSPGIRSPRGRGRAASSTRRRSGYSASGAPRHRRRHAIACSRAIACSKAAPAQGPRPPKGRARPKAAPAQRPLPAQRPCLPKGP